MMRDSLRFDPTFAEFDEMNRLAESVNGLYDAHDGRKFNDDKSAWNDDYMNKLMVQVVGNFSHERMEHLKNIVRHWRCRKAIAANDVCEIRLMMRDSLRFDPTFAEFDEMNRLAESVNGLYDIHDGSKFNDDKSAWNDDYMNKLMVQVVGNFSHERMEHLKDVVKHLRHKRDGWIGAIVGGIVGVVIVGFTVGNVGACIGFIAGGIVGMIITGGFVGAVIGVIGEVIVAGLRLLGLLTMSDNNDKNTENSVAYGYMVDGALVGGIIGGIIGGIVVGWLLVGFTLAVKCVVAEFAGAVAGAVIGVAVMVVINKIKEKRRIK
jgi:hypothetical protein